MQKSLYDLQPGDAFILYKGSKNYTVSFVSKVINGNYKVDFEIFVHESQSMAIYDFSNKRRIYNPDEWFESPWLHAKTHSMTELEERDLIKKIFIYSIRIMPRT